MLRLLPLLLTLLLCTCGPAPQNIQTGKALLLPQPQEQTDKEGYFVLDKDLIISLESTEQGGQLLPFLNAFEDAGGQPLTLMVNGTSNFRLITDSSLSAEGYVLDVSPEEIEIKAADKAGFFYASQTLRQLLPSNPAPGTTHLAIPAVHIKDAPAFGWRGFMLDVSRHFFTVDQVKDVLDIMASQKLNRFHWHLTDDQGWRIEIKAYPKLTEIGAWRADRINTDEQISDWWGRAPLQPGEEPTYGGFYTQEQIREVVDYAKQRNIEVIPEIDMPGHAQAAVAAYPEIGGVKALPAVATGGVFRYNTINPGKDETYQFAETMLNEVMDLFPFDYVHIGGDECNKEQWQIDPDAQRKMRAEGLKNEGELQSYFIHRMEEIINARDKKMIGWDEILEGGLAPNAVVMSWRGEEGGLASARAGHEVIMTPSKYCYLDLKQGHDDFEPNLGYSRSLLSDAYNYQIVPDDLTPQEGSLIKGIQANLWTESISDWSKFTYMVYPRLFAIAENAWTQPERKDWDGFTKRLLHAYQRLDAQGVRYAVSAFSPWPHHVRKDGGIEVSFTTEANGLDVRYTLDGNVPSMKSTKYTGPFSIGPLGKVVARSFINGVAVGYEVFMDLPVHLAANRPVKDTNGQSVPKLTDLQYSRLTPVDTNWYKTDNDLTLTVTFDEPTTISSLSFSTLRYTISAIYPPEVVQVFGAPSGGKRIFLPLAKLDQAEEAAVQGRNKVRSTINFSPTEVTAIQVRLKAFDSIPEGHHRAGDKARIYLDELVVE
ncbi:beta-N-acetylhexosaminidase [Neolewinella persica]|uniref:beta-N-acetylhexosaminidase n=1 Tax=Neolewinella persica TaxID=70998 RepID=UPI000370FE7B|nr:family 20 glycosylhydrolase [Neolewinella persica]